MAKYCVCCGKKGGLMGLYTLSGDDGVCSSCFHVFSAELGEMDRVTSVEEVNNLYNTMVEAVNKADYTPEGKTCVMAYINERKDKRLERATEIEDRVNKQEREKEEQVRKAQEAEMLQIKIRNEIQSNMRTCKMTTGYNFEGYKITKYLNLVNGGTVLGTGFLSEFSADLNDLFGTSSGAFSGKLQQARDAALTKMTVNAVQKGANAVIGIDFDYITFSNNMIGVVANGTAVVVEEIK